jgi:hypothetical protein
MIGKEKPYVNADSMANPIHVVLIDMDDTITKTTKYNESFLNIIQGNTPLPVDFFVEGALDFIEKMKKSGVKVGIVSHSNNGYQKVVETKLKELNIELDSFVAMNHVKSYLYEESNDIQDLVLRYGKGVNTIMAELSFKNMGIATEDYSRLSIATIGDSPDDLMFSLCISGMRAAKSIPIHINAVELSDARLSAVDNMVDSFKDHNLFIAKTTSFEGIYPIIKEQLSIKVVEEPHASLDSWVKFLDNQALGVNMTNEGLVGNANISAQNAGFASNLGVAIESSSNKAAIEPIEFTSHRDKICKSTSVMSLSGLS